MTSRQSALFLWLLWLALMTVVLGTRLSLDSELTAFLPTESERHGLPTATLVEDGYQARWLMIGIEGASADERQRARRTLGSRLRQTGDFDTVFDGTAHAADRAPPLHPARYLLIDETLDSTTLNAALARQQQRFESPMPVDRETLQRDPTDAQPRLQSLAQLIGGQTHGRATDGDISILLVESSALAQPDTARPVLRTLERELETVRNQGLSVQATGPALFAQQSEQRLRTEISRLMGWASAAIVLILALAYRPRMPALLCVLPPLTGLLSGMGLTTLLFGQVHGITLAFSSILIGISLDYAIHAVSHQGARYSIRATLWLSALTTLTALASWLFSGIPGLVQTGVLTTSGLLAAVLTSLYVMPTLLTKYPAWPAYLPPALPLPTVALSRWSSIALLAISIVLIMLLPGPVFDDRPALTELVTDAQIHTDTRLRQAMGLPEARYRLIIDGASVEEVLQQQEALASTLQSAANDGLIGSYNGAWQLLPSRHTQLQRQALLPDRPNLEASVQAAQADTVFREGTFDPFIDDVQQARTLLPVGPDTFSEIAPARADIVQALLQHSNGRWTAPVLLGQVDEARLDTLQSRLDETDARLIDARELVTTALGETRHRAMLLAALALLTIMLTIAAARARAGEALLDRVALPVLASLAGAIALLRLSGAGIGMFHVAALVLAAGLAADYRLFLARHTAELARRATTHALIVAVLSSASVFTLLALSPIPVLHAIGLTVLAGIALALMPEALAALITRTSARQRPPEH